MLEIGRKFLRQSEAGHRKSGKRERLRPGEKAGIKVHVTPNGGRYVEPDDLFESPFVKRILGLENVDLHAAGDSREQETGE